MDLSDKTDLKNEDMITVIGQEKGGVGKSLIAANLAVLLTKSNKRVLLIDADKQATCADWESVRTMSGINPKVECAKSRAQEANASDFRKKVQLVSKNYDEIIIDCGGQDSRELRAALSIADVLVAPVGPSQADLWALSNLDRLVGEILPFTGGNLRSLVVINRASPLNFHNEHEQARGAIQEMGNLTYCGVTLLDRPTYRSCFQDGKGVCDLNNEGSAAKAIAEIVELHKVIYE